MITAGGDGGDAWQVHSPTGVEYTARRTFLHFRGRGTCCTSNVRRRATSAPARSGGGAGICETVPRDTEASGCPSGMTTCHTGASACGHRVCRSNKVEVFDLTCDDANEEEEDFFPDILQINVPDIALQSKVTLVPGADDKKRQSVDVGRSLPDTAEASGSTVESGESGKLVTSRGQSFYGKLRPVHVVEAEPLQGCSKRLDASPKVQKQDESDSDVVPQFPPSASLGGGSQGSVNPGVENDDKILQENSVGGVDRCGASLGGKKLQVSRVSDRQATIQYRTKLYPSSPLSACPAGDGIKLHDRDLEPEELQGSRNPHDASLGDTNLQDFSPVREESQVSGWPGRPPGHVGEIGVERVDSCWPGRPPGTR